jgi:NAD(P)-dependent dehydrogenase (short-subunit alcohol dehydrogenase family)
MLDLNAALLDEAARALSGADGPPVVAVAADVSDEAGAAEAVARAAETLGGLDGLVGAAGIDLLRPFDRMTAAEWRRVLDVNLTGAFVVTAAALPHLRAAGQGTVVHIASGAALRPLAARTAYCAAKAGLVMFAKTLAVDLAPDIRVNAICPGIIDTPLFRQSFEDAPDPEAELERILDRYLIRRPGRPEDIAYAALFLSCAESSHVTGSSLAVDAGRTFH